MPASIRAGASGASSPSRSAPSDLIEGERDIHARVGELLTLVGLHPDDGQKYPARVLRRPAPAHRDRPRARLECRVHRLRRADLGARRLGAGADPQSDARPAGEVRPDLSLHQPQPRRGPAHGDPHRRDVSRPPRRDRGGHANCSRNPRIPYTRMLLDAVPDLAMVRPPARSREGRNPQPDRSAARLHLPSALPAGLRPLPPARRPR